MNSMEFSETLHSVKIAIAALEAALWSRRNDNRELGKALDELINTIASEPGTTIGIVAESLYAVWTEDPEWQPH